MSKLLLALLIRLHLAPGLEDDDVSPESIDDEADTSESDDDDDDDAPPKSDDDDIEPSQDEDPAPRISRGQKAIIESRARAQKAEDDLRIARAELDAARRQPVQNSQPSEDQRLWEQEEAVLNNPEAQDWQKYAVSSNRASRQAVATSQNALRRAEDMSDQAKFDAIKSTKPKLYESYKSRVEDERTRLAATGVYAPRDELLALLIGRDMRDGKLSRTEAKPGGAKRSSTPGARSDVSTSGSRLSDAEKRAKRLEGQRI